MIVIIPSSRSVNLRFLESLIDFGARFIIIDDSEGSIKIEHPQFKVYNWHDRSRLLGKNEICVPKGNGACRNFGFYLAWKESEIEEIIIALDDDCCPDSPNFPQKVEDILRERFRKIAERSKQHLNTFDLYEGIDSTLLFPRGFPYSSRLSYKSQNFNKEVSVKVLFNLGLWKGVFDINAIDRIKMDANYFDKARLRYDSVLVPSGVYISVCSGNIHFRKEIIPAVFQLPMNVEIMPGNCINRYGDIWAGYILKRLMDIRGDHLSFGEPTVIHSREGMFVKNAVSEHLACLVNEEFIDFLLRATDEMKPSSYLDMMKNLLEEFQKYSVTTSPIMKKYLSVLDASLGAWLKLLS